MNDNPADSMIERVARNLASAAYDQMEKVGACTIWDNDKRSYVREMWRQHMPEAQAAIEAMAEPTETMAMAGRNTISRGDVVRVRRDKAVDAYKAMIAAALR